MTKKEQVMDLWRGTFHDPEEFIRFYFDRKYSDADSLVYEEDGKAISALLMLPYPMSWEGITVNTSYISGACTLKEARNHGLMTLLLTDAFEEMRKRDILFSTLIPAEEWLFDYYRNMGYAAVFDNTQLQWQPDPQADISTIQTDVPAVYDPVFSTQAFPYFEQKMQQRTCSIQHPLEDYKAVIEEAYLSGGRLAIARTGQSTTPSGWALAVPEEGGIRVKEIFSDSTAVQEALLQAFARIWNTANLEYRLPPRDNISQHYGMARIINVAAALQQIAASQPDLSCTLKINDNQLIINQGTYLLSKGVCQKAEDTAPHPDIETDIPTLTKAVLGYHADELPQPLNELCDKQQPYMSLMMD